MSAIGLTGSPNLSKVGFFSRWRDRVLAPGRSLLVVYSSGFSNSGFKFDLHDIVMRAGDPLVTKVDSFAALKTH